MKGNLSKMWRSGIALLLAFCMVAGMMPTVAYAVEGTQNDESENKVINYVSLGDSMTNGYGLDGYDAEAGVYDYGYYSYANQFAAALAGYSTEEFEDMVEAGVSQGFGLTFENEGVTVNHAQLGLSAARPEDLNFLLHLDYESEEVSALLDKYPTDDKVYYRCGNHDGVAYDEIVYCHGCKWDHIDYPGYDTHVDDYPAWWTLVHGENWNDLIGYGDYWTWKELVEDYRFGTVATYIKSIFGTDAEKARAAELMASRPGKPRDDGSNGYETCYVAKHYQEQVANADVITLAMGNGNFGVWLMGRITTALMEHDGIGRNYVYRVDELLANCKDEELKAQITAVLEKVNPYIDAYIVKMMGDGLDAGIQESIKEVATYGVVSFLINYIGVIERILELNPDVEIVTVGLMNTYAGDSALADEGSTTIGMILDMLFPVLNDFISAYPVYEQNINKNELYADASFYYAEEYTIECLIHTFGDEDFMNWKGVSRQRFVEGLVGECDCDYDHTDANIGECTELDGLLWSMLNGFDMGGVTIQGISVADVKAYSALNDVARAEFAMTNKDKAASIALYLAIEDAVCKSGKLAPVTLVTLTTLELGNPALLNTALMNFTVELDKVIANYNAAAIEALEKNNVEYDQTDINDLSMVLSLPEAMSNALWTDPDLCSMLAVVARNKLGNGLGAHPSVKGHASLSNSINAAYAEGNTSLKQTISDLVELVQKYYDEAFAFAYEYAQENGYIEEATAVIGEVIAALEEMGVAVESEIADLTAKLEALEKEVAEKKAELENAVGELKEELTAAIEDLTNKIEQVKAAIAEMKAAVAELRETLENLNNVLQTMIEEGIYAGIEYVQATMAKAAEAVEKLVAAVSDKASAKLTEAIAHVKDLLNDWYYSALCGEYTISENSHYIALGDGTAAGESYVNLLAEELDQLFEGEYSFTNLSKDGLMIQDAVAILEENAEEIAKTDLVTIGFGSTGFTNFMIEQVMKLSRGEAVEFDWIELVGEKGLTYVDEAKAELYNLLVENGVSGEVPGMKLDLTDLLAVAVEAYAYSYVAYVRTLPEVENAVHELNPDALVVVVGMYNPLADVAITLNGEKLMIGEYLQYLVDAANVAAQGYAMLSGDVVYVDAPAVEVSNNKTEMTVMQFISEFVYYKAANLNPNEKGHAYITEQILNALTVSLEKEEEEEKGLWGDVNGDGKVNHNDARLVLQYAVNMDVNGLNLDLADVNGDGKVNHNDARLILQYSVGIITSFPAEV